MHEYYLVQADTSEEVEQILVPLQEELGYDVWWVHPNEVLVEGVISSNSELTRGLIDPADARIPSKKGIIVNIHI
jgi:hypothetical protein